MSYVKQDWTSGDVITAEKLNHIEDGIADAGGGSSTPTIFYYNMDDSGLYADPELTQIIAAGDDGERFNTYADAKSAYDDLYDKFVLHPYKILSVLHVDDQYMREVHLPAIEAYSVWGFYSPAESSVRFSLSPETDGCINYIMYNVQGS